MMDVSNYYFSVLLTDMMNLNSDVKRWDIEGPKSFGSSKISIMPDEIRASNSTTCLL